MKLNPIEKNIPIPPAKNKTKQDKYGFADFTEVGTSRLYQDVNEASIRQIASTVGKKNGWKFTCRKMPHGMRVWRIA